MNPNSHQERFRPADSWNEVMRGHREKLQAGEVKIFTPELAKMHTETAAVFLPDNIEQWCDDISKEVLASKNFADILFTPEQFTYHLTLQWSEVEPNPKPEQLNLALQQVAEICKSTPATLIGPFAGDGSIFFTVNIEEETIKEMRRILSDSWLKSFSNNPRINQEKVYGMWMTMLRYKKVPTPKEAEDLIALETQLSPEFKFSKLILSDNDISFSKEVNVFSQINLQ